MDSKLKELAQKATPGPWTIGVPSSVNHNLYAGDEHIAAVSFKCSRGLGDPQPEDFHNAAFIAAADPAAVLDLITRLEKAEELLGGCVIQSDCNGECGDPANCAHAEAKAFLEAER
jgi:hypothetical protein